MKISWFASQNKRSRDLKHLNFNPNQMQLVCLQQIDRYIILLYLQIYYIILLYIYYIILLYIQIYYIIIYIRYIILLYIQIYFNINIAEVKKTKQKQDDLIYLQNVVIKREIALIKKGNNS